jgi:hypothetical protein
LPEKHRCWAGRPVHLDADRDPVGGNQRAVQAQEHHPGGAGVGEELAQVRGVRGDDVEAFVQISVAGGDADPGLQRQGAQIQAVAQPAQHEHDLGVHRAGALPRASTGSAAVTGEPAGHRPQYRCGHVQPGTIRHSGLPGEAGIGFGETIFVPRARVLFTHPPSTSQNGYPALKPGEKTSLRRMQYRPGLLAGFLASTGLDLEPFL